MPLKRGIAKARRKEQRFALFLDGSRQKLHQVLKTGEPIVAGEVEA